MRVVFLPPNSSSSSHFSCSFSFVFNSFDSGHVYSFSFFGVRFGHTASTNFSRTSVHADLLRIEFMFGTSKIIFFVVVIPSCATSWNPLARARAFNVRTVQSEDDDVTFANSRAHGSQWFFNVCVQEPHVAFLDVPIKLQFRVSFHVYRTSVSRRQPHSLGSRNSFQSHWPHTYDGHRIHNDFHNLLENVNLVHFFDLQHVFHRLRCSAAHSSYYSFRSGFYAFSTLRKRNKFIFAKCFVFPQL